MKEIRPTHYICEVCGHYFYVITDKKKKHKCENCGQAYLLIPSIYGGVQVMDCRDNESNKGAGIKEGSFKVLRGDD